MAQKSTIVNLPLLNANEAKYEDCVSILRAYERWIAEIYHKAGILKEVPHVDNPEVPGTPAAPGQPNVHRQDTPDDPMREMKIVFGGDQLTRVRFAGAKDLLSGSHTPSDRFEHCSPFKPVMWHTKASLLQYSYSFLHKAESVSQVGTLKYFREKFNRRNATPLKILDCYEGSEELFLSVGRAYIVTAALSFFGMASLEEMPTKNTFPSHISAQSEENKKIYFEEVFGKFIDVYLLQKTAITDGEDYVKNYALCLIFLTILILQLKDTAAVGDGERNLINQKLLLSVFKSMGAYSKYALEMLDQLDQFLYLGNRARVRYLELQYLFEYETQSRSRCRARWSRHRAPRPSSSTSNSRYLEENDYIELHNIASTMVVELSSCKGMHVCRGGEKLTSIELEKEIQRKKAKKEKNRTLQLPMKSGNW